MKTLSTEQMLALKNKIEFILEHPEKAGEKESQESIFSVLRHIEAGTLRVCTPKGSEANCGSVPMVQLDTWIVHKWIKEAILLAFKVRTAGTSKWTLQTDENLKTNFRPHFGHMGFHDKLDVQSNFGTQGVRAVPGAIVREGAYVAPSVILMPSFVNIGAWISEGTMIDTWATAGSCAQIGKNVHVAGGVGIGGVLEPASARPVLIGDNAFLGSRVIVVEGVVVGEKAVLGANTCLTASTPIYDVTTTEKKEYRGFVPPYAVVAAGTRIKTFPGGEAPLACAYIIAYRSEKTDSKVSLNDILRETGIPV